MACILKPCGLWANAGLTIGLVGLNGLSFYVYGRGRQRPPLSLFIHTLQHGLEQSTCIVRVYNFLGSAI